ncbi:MAG: hypothetical protein D6714_10750 [Bacteroidetes bacterium]|nr:MAG: hypothetical protein D6714_10750 [Bacteroidota bacterium]
MAKKTKKKSKAKKPKVHKDLDGLHASINDSGEISLGGPGMEKITDFLNKHVDDPKLKNQTDDKDEEE